jgi:hypothetical protein
MSLDLVEDIASAAWLNALSVDRREGLGDQGGKGAVAKGKFRG